MTSLSLVMRQKRTAQHCGCPAESARLRDPFLRYIGKRVNSSVFRSLDIDVAHGREWLAGKNLADRYQIIVRRALGDEGGAP